MQIGGEGTEAADWLRCAICPHGRHVHGGPDVNGSGVRMHHKFVVVYFDNPTARVYMGSYNFSLAADT